MMLDPEELTDTVMKTAVRSTKANLAARITTRAIGQGS